mmetsp:Transcript_36979/g.59852  ORF Transcript_36979/g.59852 Transcript_36979/m.59852 type:complete len:999 (+) Transcript_36979:103-3099(+)|eukprot:CAMPEP_0184644656 /NCGR_PEP_ID=MMETSP0308-20130426/1344_1 /TAXON_ID=38269 /ORGANISM="Gloeochaete witrockiana, Strain SAG 46.84" /LENGTH=998 /DNA_ID=CAMNT_0027073319 /DNA_START=86 /DNA_END=3082 /DNA_ORIENTATION=-
MENALQDKTSLVTILYNRVAELEKDFRTQCKRKNPLDKTLTPLRNSIRDDYEKIILQDIDFAASKDVEQILWKTIFYRRIEEFRKRLRKASSPVPDGTSVATSKDSVRKLAHAFRLFLEESVAFYVELLRKLQNKYKISLDAGKVATFPNDGAVSLQHWKTAVHSCHRCLIFLGDLARYIEMNSENENKAWVAAEKYYSQAILLLPDNGNPHNQLAVLATYADNDCVAVYRYVRSLAAKQPFLTARENIVLLFEKNKAKAAALVTSKAQSEGKRLNVAVGANGTTKQMRLLDKKSKELVATNDESQALKNFLIRFVRLHGILFTRASVDTFRSVEVDVRREYRELMRADAISDTVLLKLFAINIFSVHNASEPVSGAERHGSTEGGPGLTGPGPVNAVSSRVLQALALSLAFDMLTEALRLSPPDPSRANSADFERRFKFMGPIGIMLDWLRCQPRFLRQDGSDDREGICRSQLWKEMAAYLTSLCSSLVASVLDANPAPSAVAQPPLPENLELSGFLYLPSTSEDLGNLTVSGVDRASASLDGGRPQTARELFCRRVRRAVNFGHFVAGLQEGAPLLTYDEMRKLFLTGRPARLTTLSPALLGPNRPVTDGSGKLVTGDVVPAAPSAGFISKTEVPSDAQEEDEEEEVIIFKPSAATSSASTPRGTALGPTNGFAEARPIQQTSATDVSFSKHFEASGAVVQRAETQILAGIPDEIFRSSFSGTPPLSQPRTLAPGPVSSMFYGASHSDLSLASGVNAKVPSLFGSFSPASAAPGTLAAQPPASVSPIARPAQHHMGSLFDWGSSAGAGNTWGAPPPSSTAPLAVDPMAANSNSFFTFSPGSKLSSSAAGPAARNRATPPQPQGSTGLAASFFHSEVMGDPSSSPTVLERPFYKPQTPVPSLPSANIQQAGPFAPWVQESNGNGTQSGGAGSPGSGSGIGGGFGGASSSSVLSLFEFPPPQSPFPGHAPAATISGAPVFGVIGPATQRSKTRNPFIA